MRSFFLVQSLTVLLSLIATAARADYLITPVGAERIFGINNAGDVVGAGFVRSASGVVTPIQSPAPAGPPASWAGINDVGQIVGSMSGRGQGLTSDGLPIAVSGFIDTNGTFTTLNVPRATGTYPTSINDHGVVAGYYFLPSITQGFTYANGVYTTVNAGPPFTDRGTHIYGINNAGDLVGTYEGNGIQGFIVHDGVTTLFDVPGFESVRFDLSGTQAYDINNLGQIVGWAQQVPPDLSSSTIRGFVGTNGSFDLLDFQVYGINDVGQLIGRNFIATPVPEPAGLGAFAIGLITLAGVGWRVRSLSR